MSEPLSTRLYINKMMMNKLYSGDELAREYHSVGVSLDYRKVTLTMDTKYEKEPTVWEFSPSEHGVYLSSPSEQWRELLRGEEDFRKTAVAHLLRLFRNSGDRVNMFTLEAGERSFDGVRRYPIEEFERDKEVILTEFDRISSGKRYRIDVRSLSINFDSCQDHISLIMKHVEPGALESIDLKNLWPILEEDWPTVRRKGRLDAQNVHRKVQLEMGKIVEMEQWKRAKHLCMMQYTCEMPVDKWSHFETIHMRLSRNMNTPVEIIQALVPRSEFLRGQIYCDEEWNKTGLDEYLAGFQKDDSSLYIYPRRPRKGLFDVYVADGLMSLMNNRYYRKIETEEREEEQRIRLEKISRPPATFFTIPLYLTQKIVDMTDTRDKIALRQCHPQLVPIVEKSPMSYISAILSLEAQKVTVTLNITAETSLQKEFRPHGNGVLVRNSSENWEKAVPEGDYRRLAIRQLFKVFRKSVAHVRLFKMEVKPESRHGYKITQFQKDRAVLMAEMHSEVKSFPYYLKVTALHINFQLSQTQLLPLVRHLEWMILRDIRLERSFGTKDRLIELDRLCATEQWKHATRIRLPDYQFELEREKWGALRRTTFWIPLPRIVVW